MRLHRSLCGLAIAAFAVACGAPSATVAPSETSDAGSPARSPSTASTGAPTASTAAPTASTASASPASTDAGSVAVDASPPTSDPSARANAADLPCTSVDDCWIEGGKPVARPKRLRGKKFRPCVDGEVAPICKDGTCGRNAYKC